MAIDSINPVRDPRVSHCNADVNGKNYHYLLGIPQGGYSQTVFLIHGFPDLSIGWRNQIPLLLKMGYRVVCPDIMGFGGTDAPQVPPEPMALYSFKQAADDIKELARQLSAPQIILGGHDWGGAIVYRVALWHPSLCTHIFTVCTPYWAPSTEYHPLSDLVHSGKLPNFGYQLQFASGVVEEHIKTKEQIRQLLNGMYGGKSPTGELVFDVKKGVKLEALAGLEKTTLLEREMLDYYADQYARNGMHGPLNWYRNREQNFHDELRLTTRKISTPLLFIQATRDAALPPAMSANMESLCPNMTRREVDTGHWALWEAPEVVNGFLGEWLTKEMGKGGKSVL